MSKRGQFGVDHDFYQVIELRFCFPAENALRLGWVADQEIDFSRSIIARVVFKELAQGNAGVLKGEDRELENAMGFASRNDIIAWVGSLVACATSLQRIPAHTPNPVLRPDCRGTMLFACLP